MARVVALIPDLLFGSRVQADLSGAGHEVMLAGALEAVREPLSDVEVLVVDLTDERLGGAELVEGLSGDARPRTLAFYSHVDAEARRRAERAGFDLVVPRSRMAREGAALVEGLVGGR